MVTHKSRFTKKVSFILHFFKNLFKHLMTKDILKILRFLTSKLTIAIYY